MIDLTASYQHEQAFWLEALLSEFERQQALILDLGKQLDIATEELDEDPSATADMLIACHGLLRELAMTLPSVPEEALPEGKPVDDSEIPF